MSFWRRRAPGPVHTDVGAPQSFAHAAKPAHGGQRHTWLGPALIAWVFVLGYFVGYVHYGQHKFLDRNPFQHLSGVQPGSRPDRQPVAVPSRRTDTSSGELHDKFNGGLPIETAYCSITAHNATAMLARRYSRTREQARSGLSLAQSDFAKVCNKSDLHAQYMFFLSANPSRAGYEGISAWSLTRILSGAKSPAHVNTIKCTRFEFYCTHYVALALPHLLHQHPRGEMTETTLLAVYEAYQIPPRFYPNMTEIGKLVTGNHMARLISGWMMNNERDKFDQVRRGTNMVPPELAIIYNGYITQKGTIWNTDIVIEAWPDVVDRGKWAGFVDEYLGMEGHVTKQKWIDVKEIMVLTHEHQNMFWHWLVSEVYRILLVYRFLLANPDIYIHVWGGEVQVEKYRRFFGLDRSRFISNVNVRADIVYYVQAVDRWDVPSFGFLNVIRHNLHDLIGLPLPQRKSRLLPPAGIQQSPPKTQEVAVRNSSVDIDQLLGMEEDKADAIRREQPEVVIRILFIVRDDPNVGRIVLNYQQMVSEFWKLALIYPLKAITRGHNMRIVLAEHPPKVDQLRAWRSFAEADIIIGPHGAGFANLFATSVGAHVIELFGFRHLNIFSSSRLGLAYHGVITNTTTEGTTNTARSKNYLLDIPFLLSLVQAILDQRFP